VVLTESAHMNSQSAFTDLVLTTTSHGQAKTYRFPNDLPGLATADRHVLLVSESACCLAVDENLPPIKADFVLPDGFLPTEDGTIAFANFDQWSYGSLPVLGSTALTRPGIEVAAVATNFAGDSLTFAPAGPGMNAYEYYNAARDHYFISASLADFDALDSGRFPGWKRTGWWFRVSYAFDHRLAAPAAGPWADVCRFYLPPPSDSHFFSASAEECDAVRKAHPEYTLENASAFQVSLVREPTNQLCSLGFLRVAVYRFWNGRADSNHRYVSDPGERASMLLRGWIAEGTGPDTIAFCVDDAGSSLPSR